MEKFRRFFSAQRNWREPDSHSQCSQLEHQIADPFDCCEQIREECTVRYRKSRAYVGGSARDHWCEKNVAHAAAFEDDVEGVIKKKEQAYKTYIPPSLETVPHRNPNSEDRLNRSAIHFAALGGAVNVVEFLAESYESNQCDNALRPIHLAAQYGGHKGMIRSTADARRLARACLESEGKCVDVTYEHSTTPLHFACLAGNVDVVEELLERGADVNAVQDHTLMTPLMMAAQADSCESVSLLLKYCACPKTIDNYGNTVLHFAVSGSDNPELLQILIEAVPSVERAAFVCQRDLVGVSALRLAVEENKIKSAEYLLSHHVIHHNDHFHEELMVHLAAQRQSPEMISLLCQNGWLTETRDNRGQTPLHFAAVTNQLPLVKQLLTFSANIEARDDAGYTPLLAAAAYDSIDVIKYLLQDDRAQLTALSYGGENLALIAVRREAVKTIKFLFGNRGKNVGKKLDTLKALLIQPDVFRDTTLHHAARNGNLEVFKTILPYFTNINNRNNDLQTPLHLAAKHDHVEITRRLLRTSVLSINLADKDDATPLFLSVSRASTQMIQLLLANGADAMAQVEGRKIPLDIAIREGNLEVVQLLLDEINSDADRNRRVFPLHDAVKKKQARILKMLLKKNYARIDQVDDSNFTCLDLAIFYEYTEAVQVILEHPDMFKVLRRRVPSNEPPNVSPMQNLILKMPSMAKLVLDKCITQWIDYCIHMYMYLDDTYYIPCNEDCKTMECHSDTNFDTFMSIGDPRLRDEAVIRNDSYKELLDDHPITLMLNSRHYDLLTHPVVESYISMKWNTTKRFYYCLMLFQAVYVAILTGITVNIEPENVMDENDMVFYSQRNQCITNDWKYFLCIFPLILFALGFTKTVRDGKFKGFTDFSLAALTATVSYPICGYLDASWQWRFLVLANFFAWINFINYVRRVPRFGVYVLMVWHTCLSFIRFSPVFLMFLAPFVVSFHVLLGKERGFLNLLRTMIRTIVMMTGEFDYAESISSKNNPLTFIMFFFFLFIGTMFLMNLLVGLAVSDTEKTLEKATRTRIRLQVATIHHVEVLFPPFIRRRVWKGFKTFKTNEDGQKISPRDKSRCAAFWKMWDYIGMSKRAMKKEMSGAFEPTTTPTSPRPSEKSHSHSHGTKSARQKQQSVILEIQRQLASLNDMKNMLEEVATASKKWYNDSLEEFSENEENVLNQGSGRSNPEQFLY